ncbi:MAG: dipeptidase [Fusobacteriaceae bacterium]
MKKFDMHGDIWYDNAVKRYKGEKNIIKNHHLENFKNGEIFGGIFVVWLPEEDLDEKPLIDIEETFEKFLKFTEEEIKENSDILQIITKREELDNFGNNERMEVLKGIEGLKGIGCKADSIDRLYELGYRHCSLTWNESNLLATGVKGEVERGLTPLGETVIKKMEKLGMLLDVSHLNEKSFWDVLKITTKPIIASHSNCYSICPVMRNLTDSQIKAIGKNGGVIGVNAFRGFISQTPEERTTEKLVEHIEHIIKLIGEDSVGLGFDFCDYLSKNPHEQNPLDMKDASEADKIVEILRKRGHSEKRIEKICYENILRVFKEVLK